MPGPTQVQTPLVYITYMNAMRRLHGLSEDARIQKAREVFAKARENPECGHSPEIYVAAAEMELSRNGRPDIAKNVFFLGFSRLPEPSVDFTVAYIVFVMNTGADDANVDLAVERCVKQYEDQEGGPARLAELWRVYRSYCLRCRRGQGTLAHLRDIDARVDRMYVNLSPQ